MYSLIIIVLWFLWSYELPGTRLRGDYHAGDVTLSTFEILGCHIRVDHGSPSAGLISVILFTDKWHCGAAQPHLSWIIGVAGQEAVLTWTVNWQLCHLLCYWNRWPSSSPIMWAFAWCILQTCFCVRDGGGGVVLGVRYRPCLLSLSWLEKADDSIIVVTWPKNKQQKTCLKVHISRYDSWWWRRFFAYDLSVAFDWRSDAVTG